MIHFTSKAYLVSARICGRHENYGATTSIVGVFNTEAANKIAGTLG